jgi:GTP-binding protein HflX
MAKMNKTKCVFISAQDKENVDELKEILYEEVKAIFKVRYPYNNFLY